LRIDARIEAKLQHRPPRQIAAVFESDGIRTLARFQWGLVPSWAKDPAIGTRMINARAESIAEKPGFRTAFTRRRCLIPASGFYEWRKDPMGKQPMYVGLRSKEPFGMAGLYEHWSGPAGMELDTCAIITTTPNRLMEPVHPRMPAIIPGKQRATWLDPLNEDRDRLRALLKPYPAEAMEAYPVSKRVNSPANDSPELIRPLERLDIGL